MKINDKGDFLKGVEYVLGSNDASLENFFFSALLPSELPSEWSVSGFLPACAFTCWSGVATNQSLWSLWLDEAQKHADSKSQEITGKQQNDAWIFRVVNYTHEKWSVFNGRAVVVLYSNISTAERLNVQRTLHANGIIRQIWPGHICFPFWFLVCLSCLPSRAFCFFCPLDQKMCCGLASADYLICRGTGDEIQQTSAAHHR